VQSFLILFLVLFVSFLIQTAVVPFLKIGGIQPDLVLIVIAVYAFIEGPVVGTVTGFVGGLLQDLVTIRNMGLSALSKTIAGYLAGLAKKNVASENLALPVIAVFLISLSTQTIYILLSFLVGDAIPFQKIFFRIIAPRAIYDGLLALPIYLLFLKIIFKKKDSRYLKGEYILKKDKKIKLK